MSQVGITVSDDLITPIIEAKVQAAIVEALGNEKSLIERVVAEALTRKIEPDRYSSRKVSWLEHVCQNVIRGAAEQAIQEWAASHKDVIAAEFLKQLQSKKVATSVVKSMIDGMASVAGCKWKFSVEIPE